MHGIGVDLVDISRISKILEKEKTAFINRICSENEKLELNELSGEKLVNKVSKMFAVKEAVSKAFGTGIRLGINFADIELQKDELGKPFVKLYGTTKNFFEKNIEGKIEVSLADEKNLTIAFVVIQ
ncbi:MAG: holo-ACP synthase [Alphaproteobacteria bacterium]